MSLQSTHDSVSKKKLRLITYLHPGIPVGLYEVYQHYLEEALGCESYLMVESRWSCPPATRVDPFTADEADIGFICSTGYFRMKAEGNQFAELATVGPIHIHEKSELRPVYFADVVISKEKAEKEKIKELHDLKGHRWAYNDEQSLTGVVAVLAELKRMGFNANFFGQLIHSGSHHKSLQLLLEGAVDGASIDSTTLQLWMKNQPDLKNKVHILTSLGPLPIPPIIYNSRLPVELKQQISEALLRINQIPEWQEKLAEYQVWGFKSTDSSLYDKETEIRHILKGSSVHTTYY